MKQWQKVIGVITFGAIGICSGCTRSIDYSNGEKVVYSDLPKEVQDTLIWWGEHTIISIDDTASIELPDVICFKSDYSFLRSTFGPWIISRRLRRNTDGKEWSFSGNINIPLPIVAIGDTIYVPSEYMLVACTEINNNAIFIRQTLR
ncbi:hypothetical protein [uncultured Bacteroides sp.]|uniref:hypothetical protein n=1 Tax=uncultured Bacteroides sp. TaxID=162156 RepID=UPI0025EACC19|nr:hypothetical protein [uncultured Bacteroides sp.]